MDNDLKTRVADVPLFKGCSEDELDFICEKLVTRNYNDGETIVYEGDAADEMFFILDGSVEFRKDLGSDSDYQVRATGKKGEFFGEMGLIYDRTRSVSVVAIEPLEVGVITKDIFNELKEKFESISDKIKEVAQERFNEFREYITSLLTIEDDDTKFDDAELQRFRDIFQDVDADGSGSIDRDEFEELLERLLSRQPSGYEAEGLYTKIDEDGNGEISFDEFVSGLKHLAYLIKPVEFEEVNALVESVNADEESGEDQEESSNQEEVLTQENEEVEVLTQENEEVEVLTQENEEVEVLTQEKEEEELAQESEEEVLTQEKEEDVLAPGIYKRNNVHYLKNEDSDSNLDVLEANVGFLDKIPVKALVTGVVASVLIAGVCIAFREKIPFFKTSAE